MKYIKKFEAIKDKSIITELDLSYQNLTELPDLSEYTNLKTLYLNHNYLTFLPELPKTLEYLYCRFNQLTSLPELPKELKVLNINNNQLVSLPKLPNSLKKIICIKNKLISLPELPNTLTDLYCDDNQLTSLPELPDTLLDLNCKNNQLSFDDLYEYEEWYQENKHIIDNEGLEYAYKLSNEINIYNI